MGFTPQNHHVGMLEALCDCQIRQNIKEGAKTILKVCQWCKRLSSGPLTGHDVLQTACEKRKKCSCPLKIKRLLSLVYGSSTCKNFVVHRQRGRFCTLAVPFYTSNVYHVYSIKCTVDREGAVNSCLCGVYL